MMTLKKAVAVARVMIAMRKGKFVKVSDIAIFLNCLFGTSNITGEKINKMLVILGYQIQANDVEANQDKVEKEYTEKTKYRPTVNKKGLYEVYEIERDKQKIKGLKWNAKILIQIFKLDFEKESNLKVSASEIISVAKKWELVNKKQEKINEELLIKNLEYLKAFLKKNTI